MAEWKQTTKDGSQRVIDHGTYKPAEAPRTAPGSNTLKAGPMGEKATTKATKHAE